MPNKFQEALDKIGDALRDMSELNVRTYTGTITGQVAGATAKQIMDNAFQSGRLEVVGLTSMMLDGDIDQFISNSDNVKPELFAAHVESVKTGQSTRRAIFDLFSNAIRKSIETAT